MSQHPVRRVEGQVIVPALPRQVVAAFLEPLAVRRWWGTTSELIEPRVGGIYALTWGDPREGSRFTTTGILRALQRDRYLLVDHLLYIDGERPILGPMRLQIEAVTVRGSDSVVRVQQEGTVAGEAGDWYFGAVGEAWPRVLGDLRAYFEEEPPPSANLTPPRTGLVQEGSP